MAKQINTVLSLKDKISQPLVRVSDNVDKVTREMKRSQNQVERWKNKSVKAIDNVIKRTAQIGALAGTAAITVGFSGLKELDSASAKVKSIAGDSLKLNKIQDDLLKTSNKTGIAVEMLGDTQYSAISAGIKAKDSVIASVQASKLATAGFTDTNSALSLMASTMNVFGMEGKKAMSDISDKLLVTQNLGVTSVDELSNSLGGVTPIAKSAGLSLDDVLGSVASLTKGGLETSQAMTSLKGMLSNVIKPSKQAQEEAKRLGIDFSVAAIKSKGFAGWLEEVKEKTGGSTDSLGQLFGNVNALTGALALTGDGFDEFKGILGKVENSTGMTENAYKTMTNTLEFKLDKLKNTSKNTFTKMMQSQSGLIGEYIDNFTGWIDKNEDKIQDLLNNIGKGIGAVVNFGKSIFDFAKNHEKAITTVGVFITSMYSVFKVVNTAKKAFQGLQTLGLLKSGTLLISPLGKIVFAIGLVVAAGYALYRNWDLIKEKASQLGNWITSTFNKIRENIIGTLNNVKEGLSNSINGIKEGFIGGFNNIKEGIVEKVKYIKNYIILQFLFLPDSIKGPLIAMKDSIINIFNGIRSIISNVFNIIKNIVLGAILIIIDIVTLNFNEIGSHIEQIWGNIKDSINGIWEGIKLVFFSAIDYIKNYVMLGFNLVRDVIKEKLEYIATYITIKWDSIIEWFSTLPERLRVKAISMFIAFKEGIISIKGQIITSVKEIGTNMLTALEEFPSKMLQIGKDIITGLWDGIKSMATKPVTAIKEIGGNISKGIKEKLDIHSPSKVMLEVGEYTTEGLSKGLIKKIPSLDTSISFIGEKILGIGGKTKDNTTSTVEKVTSNGAVEVTVIVQGNVIGNESFIDEIGNEVYTKVKLALENM